MNYSLWNFKDYFLQESLDLTYNIAHTDTKVSSLTLLSSDQTISDETACICEGILVNQPMYRTVMFQGQNQLCFPIASPVEVLNAGNQMIEYYSDWEDELYESILEKKDFSNILDKSAQILHHPLALFSQESDYLYTTANWNAAISITDILEYLHSVNIPELTPTICSIGAHRSTFVMAYFHTVDNQSYFLLAYENGKKFTPGISNLFQTLCQAVVNSIKVSDYFSQSYREQLQDYLQKALLSARLNPKRLSALLENAEWPANEYFTFFAIQPLRSNIGISKESLLQRFQDYFFYSVCFYTEKPVVASHTISDRASEQTLILITYSSLNAVLDIAKAVRRLAPDKSYSIGQSISTANLYNISAYYRQSILALDYAIAKKQHIIHAKDITLKILASSARNNLYVQTFLHPDLLTLSEYDEAYHDSLLETLFTYLMQGKNANNTAQALFIHRNTLRARLSKIKELIQSNLDDSADTEQLLASFMIYNHSSF